MEFSRGDAAVSSVYPVVSEYEQMVVAGVEVRSYASIGGARELHTHAYLPMQSHPAPPSSFYHFGAGFFDSPGFGGRGEASAPVAGSYGGGVMVDSGGMDADLQAFMNNGLYGMWSNAPWGFEGGFSSSMPSS